MDADDEYPWLTTAWFAKLTRYRDRVTLSPEELAELMAKYQTPELIRTHMAVEAGILQRHLDPFTPGHQVPPDVLVAVKLLSEVNCWELLSVVLDEGTELSSGPEATMVLRAAYDPLEGTLTFTRRSPAPVSRAIRPGRDSANSSAHTHPRSTSHEGVRDGHVQDDQGRQAAQSR